MSRRRNFAQLCAISYSYTEIKRKKAHEEYAKVLQELTDSDNQKLTTLFWESINNNWSVYPEVNLRRIRNFKNKYLND